MSPVKYYTIMRKSKDPRWIKYEMVRYAKEEGVKPAATEFGNFPFRMGQLHDRVGVKPPPEQKGYLPTKPSSFFQSLKFLGQKVGFFGLTVLQCFFDGFF